MIKRIYLEITNACNLNCPFCENEKGHYFMPIDIIKDCLKQIKEVCDYVYLHVLGEPLLHPDIEEILSYCDNINLHVQLVSNGLLLNKDILRHKCLRKLAISLHAVNNVDINNSYFNNIEEIISDNKVNVELRFYDYSNLDDKLKDFIKKLHKKYQIEETTKKNSYKLKDNTYIYVQDFFRWPNINDDVIGTVGKCLGAVSQIAILHDLRVTLCCLDPKGHNSIGSLSNSSLKEILAGKEYKKVLEDLKNNQLTKELCTKCSYRLRFDGRNN